MKLTNEWKLVLVITLLVTLFSQIPLIVGYFSEGEDEVFMGIPDHVTDANNHLHWMLQAKDGAILFTNKFTSEEVPALIFNPYHLVVGNLSRFTGLGIITWYHIISIMAIFGFLLYLYTFISYFVKKRSYRVTAFLVASLTAGFGVFWKLSKLLFDKWIVSSELWVTDMNVFQSFGHPHFTLAMLLMLAAFLNGYKALEENSRKHAVYSGLLGLLLGLIHIFDVVTVALVFVAWFGYKWFMSKKFEWKQFEKIVLIGGLMSPAVLYYLWIILFNPTYAKWNALNQTVTPMLHELISGFGIIFFLAVLMIYRERKKLSFFSIWMIANLVLVYLPINVQRRFLLGIGIPMAILATIAFYDIVLPWINKQRFSKVIVTVLIILTFSTTIYLMIDDISKLHNDFSGDYGHVKYLSTSEVEAINWIEENLNNDVIIIAPLRIGNHIPANTNNRVYLGHWAQTIDYEAKKLEIDKFYRGEANDVYGDIVWNGNATETNVAYENEEVVLVYN